MENLNLNKLKNAVLAINWKKIEKLFKKKFKYYT